MASSSKERDYFNLFIEGLGYANRAREIASRGKPSLSVDISALHGPSDAVEYCRFDVRVAGTRAQELIRKYTESINSDDKVLIGFRLGDLWIDQFTYAQNHKDPEKAGKPGVSLKARLLFIPWIKINGQKVYDAEAEKQEASAAGSSQPASQQQDLQPAADQAA